MRVNVIGHSGSDIYIIKNDGNSYSITVNFFLISDGESSHYVTITEIERFLSSDINKNGHRKYHCSNCLHLFY